MKFLAIYKPDQLTEPTPENIAAMGELIAEMQRAGVLVLTEGFGPSTSTDARLRLSRGKFTVTDGPFTESKELIAGFAMLEVASREEAIEWGKRFLAIAGDGESEIRPLLTMTTHR
jgi:hypothetical protein